MRLIRVFYRFVFFILAAVVYFPLAGLLQLVIRDLMVRRRVLSQFCSYFSRFICFVFGIKVEVQGDKRYLYSKLLVSNHLSYIDIFVVSAYFPGCFVTSVEMKNTPFLGHIASLASCVFVERRNRQNLSQEVSDMTNTLKAGGRIILYPEGTSTNGESVLRFRRPLFQAAIDAQKNITPVTLNYHLSQADRDEVCWYGDMTFFGHFLKFLARKKTEVEFKIHSTISPLAKTPEQLAELCHAKVSEAHRAFA